MRISCELKVAAFAKNFGASGVSSGICVKEVEAASGSSDQT
jgi:hypothetical protein